MERALARPTCSTRNPQQRRPVRPDNMALGGSIDPRGRLADQNAKGGGRSLVAERRLDLGMPEEGFLRSRTSGGGTLKIDNRTVTIRYSASPLAGHRRRPTGLLSRVSMAHSGDFGLVMSGGSRTPADRATGDFRKAVASGAMSCMFSLGRRELGQRGMFGCEGRSAPEPHQVSAFQGGQQ